MTSTQSSLAGFARHHHIEGLSESTLKAVNEGVCGYSVERARKLVEFHHRIREQLLQHPVIVSNGYTRWFETGQQTTEQIRAFIVQFSVFSNQFLIAQTNKMINADSLESMRASKEILANEIGVRFQSAERTEGDPLYGATQGSIEGSTFRFAAAHFEWLYAIARKLGLEFNEIGKAQHAVAATTFFCDELIRLYGGNNYQQSQAASYAVENWAAAGFWKELIEGFRKFNQRTRMDLPLGFFVWHDRIESQHAEHTQEELEELYFSVDLDEDTFIRNGNTMLDGVRAFWDGLEQQRHELARPH